MKKDLLKLESSFLHLAETVLTTYGNVLFHQIATMFKQRSHDTHHGTHLPQIEGQPGHYEIALLGDSLFERFKTTGKNLSINQNSQILNLGVGGDKVTNVQYRINQGLIKSLKQHQPNLKVIYIHMGSNDLKKAGFRKQEAEIYNNLIEELRTNYPDIPIVITALFIQRGLANSVIGDANDALKTISVANRCEFLPFGENQDGIMSEDNVHLNEFGYTRWNEILENDMKSRQICGSGTGNGSRNSRGFTITNSGKGTKDGELEF